jgi:hypothetical protein
VSLRSSGLILSLSVFENLATWALGVIMFTLFYILLVLVLAFA